MSTQVRKSKADLLEEKFYAALRDVFVGAKVEGESGYINLMRIKSRYFTEGVLPELKELIAAELAAFPDFKGELFDKLYTFFHRYFSESGSIYFRHTPLHQNVYERVYTNERDVMLFWKTHMLYYVKTDRLFRSLTVEPEAEGGLRFFFDASTLPHKKNNEKRELVYEFRERRAADGTLVFTVGYSEKGRKTKTDEIIKQIKKEAKAKATSDELERAFRLFERQSEVDYFINRDARQFLEEQFRLWLYQYVFRGENVWQERRLAELQALQRVALRIIDFIAQFENELVKIWNKPKFARRGGYVITLDKIAERDEALARRLLGDEGMKGQTAEWRELNLVGAGFKAADVWRTDLMGEHLEERYRFLPLDTRHFKGLEPEILALFDDLDDALDGWLIKSENYQALNTILPKFRGRVKCIYIDPPYNTNISELAYVNNYKHSSWLTMIDNRLALAKQIMHEEAICCTTIDDFEVSYLLTLLHETFGEENHQATVVIRSKPQGRAAAAGFSVNHEYAIFVSRTEKAVVGRLPRDEVRAARYAGRDDRGIFAWANFRKTGGASTRVERPKLYYPIYVGPGGINIPEMEWDEKSLSWTPLTPAQESEEIVFPKDEEGEERVWSWSWERARSELDELVARKVNAQTQIHRKYRPNQEGMLPGTWWDSSLYSASESGTKVLQNILGSAQEFSYPKSLYAVMDCLRACNFNGDVDAIGLDFFAGSGTTAHACINLNREDGGRRKYVLVEANEYFHTVILPRVKKVVFADKWKDGKPAAGSNGTSHFCKYYELEQYEETLQRVQYEDSTFFDNPYEDPFHSYVFLRDVKLLDAAEVDPERASVRVDFARLYPDVDAAETLSNLLGKRIRRLAPGEVEFADGEKLDLDNLDFKTVKPLIWWR